MKKALAILAVAILGATFAFAASDVTNTFTIGVTCPATVMTNTAETVALTGVVAGASQAQVGKSVDWDFQFRGTDNDGSFSCTFTEVPDAGLVVSSNVAAPTLTGLTAVATQYDFVGGACNAQGNITISVSNVAAAAWMTAGSYNIKYTAAFIDN